MYLSDLVSLNVQFPLPHGSWVVVSKVQLGEGGESYTDHLESVLFLDCCLLKQSFGENPILGYTELFYSISTLLANSS